VKLIVIATAALASMTALGRAQESAGDDLWEPASLTKVLSTPTGEADPKPYVLPASLMKDEPASFSLGASAGYLSVRGADRGTWFGGVQARLHVLAFLAAEASITFHENHYENGDVVVTQYPVQLTAFLYIIPAGPIRPYILGGVGWYYTRVDYRDAFSLTNKDHTDHFFGEHLGAGAELMLGPRTSIDADVRYIFLNATNDKVIHRDFNYWQLTFGLNFYF